MIPPLLASTCFVAHAQGTPDQYRRLARVLEYSARRQCPAWRIVIDVADAPPVSPRQNPSYEANVHKMARWCAILDAAADGDRLLFVDIDCVILQPIDALWDLAFDVAYTVKSARYPINTGVVAVRVSSPLRTFFAAWHAETERLLLNKRAHEPWFRQFGGIHQAALGSLLASDAHARLNLLRLPCRVWNCEDATWEQFGADTRILHVKSALRAAVFNQTASPRLGPLVKLWRALEREALVAAEAAPA